ncbi:MAG: hypothetical protein IJP33_05910 [Firmicutes bacterium]|nr:hypothetical protein [Bacillota bacterium]
MFDFKKVNSSYYLYCDFYLNGVLVASDIQLTQVGSGIGSDELDSAFFRGFILESSSNTVPFMLDEIRITSANVPNLVSPVPYEDNLVWVLPDSTNLAANTLAIQSDYLSGKYRVGGIRPSMVEKGHVWFQISIPLFLFVSNNGNKVLPVKSA